MSTELPWSRKKELTNGGNCCDDLTELELVEDGGLTSSIKTNHQNSHLFLGKKPAEKLRECKPHSGCGSLHIERHQFICINRSNTDKDKGITLWSQTIAVDII